jgi:hypothetical protein
MSNLPEGTGSLGPIYIPTETKELFVKACEKEQVSKTNKLKGFVKDFILKHFPDTDVKV